MNRSFGFTFALMVTFLSAVGAFAQQAAQPNIIVVVADDLGFADVGFNGAKDIKTPHIDRLAASGVRFESFYVQHMCTPTRAALMTGRYPMRFGMQTFVITPGQSYGLPTDERTIAEALRAAGYRTYALGKWHLGHADKAY
jgi:arylsulfatase A-like enzyme